MGLLDTYPDTYLPRTNSGAFEIQDHLHEVVEDGLFFTAFHRLTDTASTAPTVLITTPATGAYHMYFGVETNKPVSWTFSEAPNATATGSSAITGLNNNRVSVLTDPLTLTVQGTYTSSGTILASHIMGASTGGPQSGVVVVAVASANFRILNVSTKYLLRVVPAGSATTTIIQLYYYVHVV